MSNKPQSSIILLSYNNFEQTTGPCLASLAREEGDFEIVIVDNGSDAQTCLSLEKSAAIDDRILLHFNRENRGYAGGNNDGVALASGEILILLNSDTIIPPGMIGEMIRLIQKHPDWDMLGPVTNACGNEQQIFTRGDRNDVESILKQGAEWCRHSPGLHYQTDLLLFFCVVCRHALYKRLNGLDESFGLGYFEDNDFCHRAHQVGAKLMISEELFIYHKGSGSFSSTSDTIKRLMRKNRRLFEKKHHLKQKTLHVRNKNLNVLQRYRSHIVSNEDAEAMQFKALNRLQRARELMPRSLLKTFRYKKQLKLLEIVFSQDKRTG